MPYQTTAQRFAILPDGFALAVCAVPTLADDYGPEAVERVTSIYYGNTFRVDIQGWPAVVFAGFDWLCHFCPAIGTLEA